MVMDVNAYLARQYPAPPCWALVADVYAHELQQGVTEFRTVDSSIRSIASAFRVAIHKGADGFERIAAPRDYCVVLMGRRPGGMLHHCGIWYEGSVLHAYEDSVVYQDLASLSDQYGLIEFWARPQP